MSAARTAAARVLMAVLGRQATLADEIERARPDIGDARDRALLLEMVAGTLRWQNALDAVIARASGRGIDAIDPPVLAVLRLGTYQLRHLTRIPPHAIVHESVETVRAIGAPHAAGFVNAVMRTLIRRGPQLKLPARPGADARAPAQVSYLTTTLSHPEWLVRRWLARYGFDEAERWCAFNNTTPGLTARSAGRVPHDTILARLDAAGIEATTSSLVPGAIVLPPGAMIRLPSDLRAELVFQDEPSQLVGRAVGVQPGERVLDLCAAPGGKTLLMASDLAATWPLASPPIVASDRRPKRVALLSQTIAAAPHPVLVVALDASEALPFGPSFDAVLVDAPCSGLGTLRREPDIKWSRQESDLAELAAVQGRMLRQAANVVRPGGRLVYATCSSEPDENRDVVDAFLAEDRRYALRGLGPSFPGGLLDPDGCLQTEPGRHQLDAFFAAVLVRQRTTQYTFLISMPADRLAPSRSFSSSLRPIRKRVWTLGRFFVLVVLLGVTFAAFFLTAMRVTTRAREVKVPDVRGKSVNAATAALADEGLVLKIELTRPDASVPADHVFSQDPGPGTVLRRERAVRVRVSQGVVSPPLPPLVGQPVRTAELTLSQAQIGIDNEAEIHTASYPADTVVAEDPPAKDQATKVALLVNRGDGDVTFVMPDVIGTLALRSVEILRRHGFRVTVAAEVPYPGLPPGVVVKQTPQAGFEIGYGDPVQLEVSR